MQFKQEQTKTSKEVRISVPFWKDELIFHPNNFKKNKIPSLTRIFDSNVTGPFLEIWTIIFAKKQ